MACFNLSNYVVVNDMLSQIEIDRLLKLTIDTTIYTQKSDLAK